jgi:hypothetical protein
MRSQLMTEVEQLEKRIENLSPEELSRLRAWFFEFDARVWDERIEADAKAGKLDGLIAKALADYKAGKAREL